MKYKMSITQYRTLFRLANASTAMHIPVQVGVIHDYCSKYNVSYAGGWDIYGDEKHINWFLLQFQLQLHLNHE